MLIASNPSHRRVANVFFLAIAILQFFPLFQSINPWVAAFPLIFIIFLTALKDGIEDWKRNLSDKRINGERVTALGAPWVNVNARFHEGSLAGSQCSPLSSKITLFFKSMFQNRSGQGTRRPESVCSILNNRHSTQPSGAYKWTTKTWADVLVGDVILLKENDPIPADTIILSSSNSDGSCYVETMNLDGETNLKTRAAVEITQTLTSPSQLGSEPLSLHVELPNPSLHSFTGTLHRPSLSSSASLGFSHLLLRGCHLRNTDWVVGMVIYTGAECKIRLNAGKTPSKRSYNEKMMNVQV